MISFITSGTPRGRAQLQTSMLATTADKKKVVQDTKIKKYTKLKLP